MLDVDPCLALVGRVEVEAGKFRPGRAVGRPATNSFTVVEEVTVVVAVGGEPDVVVDTPLRSSMM